MTADKPIGQMNQQTPGDSPLEGYSDALVDDTTVLVDGTDTLTGSQATRTELNATKIVTPVPRPIIRIAR